MPLSAFLIALLTAGSTPEPARTELVADVDGDGRADRLTFHVAADGMRGFLEVVPASAGTSRTSPLYPAWKATPARLDAARDAIVLGTWTTKRTRPGEPPRRSIWVVAFEGDRWIERWRGSALARPFVDFTMRDLDGDGRDELVVRECEGPSPGYAAYAWQGFGFAGRARLAIACDDNDAGDPRWERLKLRGGRLWLDD